MRLWDPWGQVRKTKATKASVLKLMKCSVNDERFQHYTGLLWRSVNQFYQVLKPSHASYNHHWVSMSSSKIFVCHLSVLVQGVYHKNSHYMYNNDMQVYLYQCYTLLKNNAIAQEETVLGKESNRINGPYAKFLW